MTTIYTSKKLPVRSKHDYYPTPQEFADYVVKNLLDFQFSTVCDPGAGDGVWGIALNKYKNIPSSLGIEIQDKNAGYAVYDEYLPNTDFLTWKTYSMFDLFIGNPPYGLISEFLDKCFDLWSCDGHIMFLLRLTFLESVNRYKKYFTDPVKRPKEVFISSNRISFSGDGKSSNDAYMMVHWERGYTGETILKWINWKDK